MSGKKSIAALKTYPHNINWRAEASVVQWIDEMPSALKKYPKRVVILGGGFGGVRAALRLNKLLPRDYEIVLVDKKAYHLPAWQLYETATAFYLRATPADYERIQRVAAIPYSVIFKHTRVRFLQATVRDVFLSDRSVALSFHSNEKGENEHTGLLHFKYAVLALGSETNYFGIKGLADRSLGLKGLADSLNLRNSLEELYVRKKKGEPIDIVIGGGGFTGVELAGELPGYLSRVARAYGHDYLDTHITIVEGGKCVLGGAAPWIVDRAEERLQKLGITLLMETPIEQYDGQKILLKGGGSLPADLLVWTAGVRANALLEHITGADLTKTCMVVTEHLQLPHYSHVYGIGDNVFCFDQARQCAVPATAQRALDQAEVAAHNISAEIAKAPLALFFPRTPVFIVPIGGKYALADIHGVRLEGALAWCAKMLIGLLYLFTIVPVYRALYQWTRSLLVYTRND